MAFFNESQDALCIKMRDITSSNCTLTPVTTKCPNMTQAVFRTPRSPPTWTIHSWVWITALALMIFAENGMVCLVFFIDKKLRKRQANIMVFSQACADLTNGILFVPAHTVETYLGKSIVAPYVIGYILFVSLFINLFILALDRYLALMKPLIHHIIMDVNRTVKVVLSLWILPMFLTLIPLFWESKLDHIKKLSHRIYLGTMWLIMFVLCLSMIIMYLFLYGSARRTIQQRTIIIASLNQHKDKKIKKVRKELRVTHLFGLLLVFFILAYLPILYMNLMDILGKAELIPPVLQDLSLYSLVLNSFVNPILCILLKKDYQKVVKKIIGFRWLKQQGNGSLNSITSYKTDIEMDELNEDCLRKRVERWIGKLSTPRGSLNNSNNSDKRKSFPQGYLKKKTKQKQCTGPDHVTTDVSDDGEQGESLMNGKV